MYTQPTISSGPGLRLFERLRSETADRHRKLEEEISPFWRFQAVDAYQRYLACTYPFYFAAEKTLGDLDWRPAEIDFESRRKAGLLIIDLTFFGAEVPTAPGGPELSVANLQEAIGCLYVLEGATLGGQVITRHLKTLGIEPSTGGSFFAGYGSRTGEMWKSFQASATSFCRDEDDVKNAVHGAKRMFDLFSVWMSQGLATKK
jgi:heme oxygenase